MPDTVRIKINGFEFPVRSDATILDASREAYGVNQWDIHIPTLGYLKGVQEDDESGVCVVEVAGHEGLVNASTTQVEDGMDVQAKSSAVIEHRTKVVRDYLNIHNQDCKRCVRTDNCELQTIVRDLFIVTDPETNKRDCCPIDDTSYVIRDNNKCIKCGRCVVMCNEVQAVHAIDQFGGKGLGSCVRSNGAFALRDTNCVNCGQCIVACPVGALRERDDTDAVREAIADPKKFVVAQVAPAVRAAMGEEFGYPVGSNVEGIIPGALRALGFDRVYDTALSADLTIVEEANEFIDRLNNGGVLPMFTSCCPAWVKFIEQEQPGIIDHISSCKAPHTMFGATIKRFIHETMDVPLEDIVVVSVMPCTAKKFEITRDDEDGMGVPDVDVVLTTREIARMVKDADIRFESLPQTAFDDPLGRGTGAGIIFGATGGVMEAALRTAVDWLGGTSMDSVDYEAVRGTQGIKEAELEVAGKKVRVAVASGLANAKTLIDQVAAGQSPYDFIEVMACPGGCVNGGGQPQQVSDVSAIHDLRAERASSLYAIDKGDAVRKSHENPEIKALYDEMFEKPGSDVAHQMLHTTYVKR